MIKITWEKALFFPTELISCYENSLETGVFTHSYIPKAFESADSSFTSRTKPLQAFFAIHLFATSCL